MYIYFCQGKYATRIVVIIQFFCTEKAHIMAICFYSTIPFFKSNFAWTTFEHQSQQSLFCSQSLIYLVEEQKKKKKRSRIALNTINLLSSQIEKGWNDITCAKIIIKLDALQDNDVCINKYINTIHTIHSRWELFLSLIS